MENRNYIPFQFFGEIKFGDNYLEVRREINAFYEQHYFDKESKNFSDYFESQSLKVEYDYDNNVLSFYVFFDEKFDFIYQDKNLCKMTFAKVRTYLKTQTDDVLPYDIGFYSTKLGITVCNDNCGDDNEEGWSSLHLVRKEYMDF